MGDIRKMFDPKNVAVFGDVATEEAATRILLDNLLDSGKQKVFWITDLAAGGPGRAKNRKRGKQAGGNNSTGSAQDTEWYGLTPYPDIESIPEKIDIAVISLPAPLIPEAIERCGKARVEGAIIVSNSYVAGRKEAKKVEAAIKKLGHDYGLRILGPNRGNLIRPGKGLNASIYKNRPEPGKVAFVTQSSSLGAAVLDWAAANHIGFSMVVSLGSMIGVDFGDLIDLIGEDPQTRSIMLFMESVGTGRKFMSAARGFARNKPIIVVKPGQFTENTKAFLSHAGRTSGYDSAYDSAFRRAGVVRVQGISDLFNAAEVLHSRSLPRGPNLAIVTNVDSLGIIAADFLLGLGGKLAPFSDDSAGRLKRLLAPQSGIENPLDLTVEAGVERFVETMGICLDDTGVDGIVVIYAANRTAHATELATAITQIAATASKPIIVTWMGARDLEEGREILRKNHIPTYTAPEEAVKTYFYMHRYRRNLDLLYETPAELPVNQSPPKNNLRAFIKRTLREGRTVLTEAESKNFLANYGIPTTTPFMTESAAVATGWADRIGYPVVLKVVIPGIVHRSDIGGMATVSQRSALAPEYEAMLARVKKDLPDAEILGVTVEKLIEEIDYQLILGLKKDTDFGSVIIFGAGGIGAEVFNDISFGIPPLNETLARHLMEETEVYQILKNTPYGKKADLAEIAKIIVSFSNLIVDFPEISEMSINPLVIARGRTIAANARAVLEDTRLSPSPHYTHLAISPYPTRYVTPWQLSDGREILLRPVRPEDEPLEHEMLTSLSDQAMRLRFFSVIRDISHEMLVRYCNIDYDREMAIVAEIREGGRRLMIGVARLISDPDYKSGEFAVLVHDAFQGHGLGYKLVDVLIGIAEDKGLETIYGDVLMDNRKMLAVCRKLGFTTEEADEETTRVVLHLR
jgi:acetyltransferase